MDAAPAVQDERCARCGGAFHCGARDAAPCPCGGIKLDAPTLALLRERHTACLCLACLRQLAATPAG